MTRTVQNILAERRSVALEQMHERDATARAVLQFQIDELDRELDRELVLAKEIARVE